MYLSDSFAERNEHYYSRTEQPADVLVSFGSHLCFLHPTFIPNSFFLLTLCKLTAALSIKVSSMFFSTNTFACGDLETVYQS